jgi:hypothetical protein
MENLSGCDAESCAVDDLGRPCCAPSDVADASDRISQIDPALKNCAIRRGYQGPIVFATTFDANGVVIAVRPVGFVTALVPSVFECIAGLVRDVRFPRSRSGATLTEEYWFSY